MRFLEARARVGEFFLDGRPHCPREFLQRHGLNEKEAYSALDTSGMASAYQVKYLDSKYVLDRNGVIRWTDIYALGYETAKKVWLNDR